MNVESLLYQRHIFKLKDETWKRDAVSHRVPWCSQTRFRVQAEFPGETCALSFPEEDEKVAGRGAPAGHRLIKASGRQRAGGLDRRVHTREGTGERR